MECAVDLRCELAGQSEKQESVHCGLSKKASGSERKVESMSFKAGVRKFSVKCQF